MFESDFLFRGSLSKLDPDVAELIDHEADRQAEKLILIPSESSPPAAVRKAQGSVFQNIYAEGYPHPISRYETQEEILDYERRLTHHRRYSNLRYYQGVEYADVVEALARRRCAEAFSTPDFSPDEIFVNVQALSGAPANNAVYAALLQPGDTIMGMSLLHGGHLTHGSPANRSGKLYNAVSYEVDPETELLNYDQMMDLAKAHRPKMIIAGYTSYPWAVDWAKMRKIADKVGAYLLADISHVAGLVVTGVYPTPVGYADVVTFTTHKTLCGPRGACILTFRPRLCNRIDRAVFPGEQGGPHVNTIAAIATTFKLARTEQFRRLQHQIAANATHLAQALAGQGLRIPYGGTNTHMLLVDCKSAHPDPNAQPLMGDVAARILDIAGIVCNRNTIPGDESAGQPSGIRLGTPWITERGLKEPQMEQLAQIIAHVLKFCMPCVYAGRRGPIYRAKIDFDALKDAKRQVYRMARSAPLDYVPKHSGYPHYELIEDRPLEGLAPMEIYGSHAADFLQYATTNDVFILAPGQSQATQLLEAGGRLLEQGTLYCLEQGTRYRLVVSAAKCRRAAAWLRALSDGYVRVDPHDVYAKLPGPVVVRDLDQTDLAMAMTQGEAIANDKPYYIGLSTNGDALKGEPLPIFNWKAPEEQPVQRTPLYDRHQALGARLVNFAGWEMPVRYERGYKEHLAVRQSAGLFDVAHMGVFDFCGTSAKSFLEQVTTNDVIALAVGQSHYSYLLGPDGVVIDDDMLYRIEDERFMMVVNASNNDKDWAWLDAVNQGQVCIDSARPWVRLSCPTRIRNLCAPESGDERRVDLSLQGPNAFKILQALTAKKNTRRALRRLQRTKVMRGKLGGFDLIISRTGYTGELCSFELFVHPERAAALWDKLIEAGEPFGLKPIGLGARDSLRIEAGLPLYGHELAGPLNLGPGDADYSSYVKTHKPFFIGRQAFIDHETKRNSVVIRFRMIERGVRVPKQGDPLVSLKGRVIGLVTSCSIDREGHLVGQAYVKKAYAEPEMIMAVFQTTRSWSGKPKSALKVGDRVQLHDRAVVLGRFMKCK